MESLKENGNENLNENLQENLQENLIETACEELLTYGLWSDGTRAKRWLKRNVFHKQTVTEDTIFWPTGLLAAGLCQCLTQEKVPDTMTEKVKQSLEAYFMRWQKKGCPLVHIDDLLSGEAFLWLCKNEENEKYRAAVDKMADYALAYPADETGSFFYRSGQEYIFADSIGQTCPFLYEYGKTFERKECMELAVKQIANFLAYGIDGVTGLPYHGYEIKTGTKYGIIGWGRAVGWLMRGMMGCMVTQEGIEKLRKPFVDLAESVIAYQRKDGYFSWQLQALEGPADTSATGMICAALQEGLRREILQGEAYELACKRGRQAMNKSTKNGRVYDCSGECMGFAQYPQTYGAYPWALGTALVLM